MAGLLSGFLGLVLAVGGAPGRASVEEPRYDVVQRLGDVEIRRYGPRIAAEATVSGAEEQARNAGFRKVAGYIFGGNRTRTSIAMTAPVVQSAAASQKIAMTAPVAVARSTGDAWTIQFIMPASYRMDTLPTPTDPAVRLRELPPQTYAVLRFSGSRAPQAMARRTVDLSARLDGSPWRAAGQPVAWFYDPPWTLPALRRNEVAVPVAHTP